jgi:hypothetical protein
MKILTSTMMCRFVSEEASCVVVVVVGVVVVFGFLRNLLGLL